MMSGKRCLLAALLLTPAVLRAGESELLGEVASEQGFFFGTAISDAVGFGEPPLRTEPDYRDAVSLHYNSATSENSFKWRWIAPRVGEFDFTDADASVAFADQAGLRYRAHTLVWGEPTSYPSDLVEEVEAAADPAARLLELLDEHITTVMGRYGSRVDQWDVVNEPLRTRNNPNNILQKHLGDSYVAESLRIARAADPDGVLFVNFSATMGVSTERFDEVVAVVSALIAEGAPIDGVGLQAHFVFGQDAPDPAEWQRRIGVLADLGVIVELTEVSVSERDFDDPPSVLGGMVSACRAVDACAGITMWGADDGHVFWNTLFRGSNTGLLDAQYRPKPIYTAALEALVAQSIPGDCDGDGSVRINELVLAVSIALGDADLGVCNAADGDGDRAVSIAELVAAVSAALA